MKRSAKILVWTAVVIGSAVFVASCDRWPIVATDTVTLGNDG